MKELWGDRGTGLDPVKGKALGFECFYEDIRDATKTSQLEILKTLPFAGVYACAQGEGWHGDLTARAWADLQSELLTRCDLGRPDAPRVHLNIERHDPQWILAALQRWRAHRQKRVTALVIEGHQGGWFRQIAAQVAALNMRVIAEAYHGDMTPFESAPVLADVIAAGVPAAQADVMLAGDHLRDWFDNPVFSQGRLP